MVPIVQGDDTLRLPFRTPPAPVQITQSKPRCKQNVGATAEKQPPLLTVEVTDSRRNEAIHCPINRPRLVRGGLKQDPWIWPWRPEQARCHRKDQEEEIKE